MGRSNTTRRGPLPAPRIRADDPHLTRFAGLVPLIRFATHELDLQQRLLDVVDPTKGERKYKVHLVLFAFLVGALAGVWRLTHLEWLRGDAVVEKFLRLPSWPVRKVFAGALASCSSQALKKLAELLTALGLAPLVGQRELTIDFDSSVVVSFGEHEGAVFGYCGKGIGAPPAQPPPAPPAGRLGRRRADGRARRLPRRHGDQGGRDHRVLLRDPAPRRGRRGRREDHFAR